MMLRRKAFFIREE